MYRPDGSVRRTRRSINEPGHAHELTFSCHRRWPLLSKDRTRQWFVEALDQARQRWAFELWAYVIMPEHAHILLWPTQPDYEMEHILKAIKLSVSRRATIFLRHNAPQWLDRLAVRRPDGRIEHRFWEQGGGYDRNVYREDAAWNSVHYLHNNPVRRGLVATPTEWRWSSARWYEGLDDVALAMDNHPEYPPPQ